MGLFPDTKRKLVCMGCPDSFIWKSYANVILEIHEKICKRMCIHPNLQVTDNANAGKSSSRKGNS